VILKRKKPRKLNTYIQKNLKKQKIKKKIKKKKKKEEEERKKEKKSLLEDGPTTKGKAL
jgi:hypothetical protein